MRTGSRVVITLATLLLIFLCSSELSAQVETAALSGRVTDQTSAVLVGAQVEIKNTETGITTTVNTNEDGIYVAPSLKPGSYLMSVNKQGFRTVSVTGLMLNVPDTLVR